MLRYYAISVSELEIEGLVVRHANEAKNII